MPKKFNKNKRRVKRGPCIATRSLIIPSLKFVQVSLPATFPAVSSSWSIYEPTNAIRQGTDHYSRLGRGVMIDRIHVKGVIVGGQSNLATDDQRNVVRLVVAITDGSFTSGSLSGIGLTVPITNANVTGLLKKLTDVEIPLTSTARDSTGYMPAQRAISLMVNVGTAVEYNDSIGGFSPFPRINIFVISDSLIPPNPGFVSGFIQTQFRSMTV